MPFIKRAQEEGYAVIVTNTNDNSRLINGKKILIRVIVLTGTKYYKLIIGGLFCRVAKILLTTSLKVRRKRM